MPANWAASGAARLSGSHPARIIDCCCTSLARQTGCSRKTESRLQRPGLARAAMCGATRCKAERGRVVLDCRGVYVSLHRGAAATLLAAASESNAKVTAMQLLLSLRRGQERGRELAKLGMDTLLCALNCVRANPVLKWTRTDTFYGFLRNEKVEAPLGTVRIGASLVPMHLYLV